MRRRAFLAAPLCAAFAKQPSILPHEHVLVDFIGADQIRPGRYDREEVFRVARPKLEALAREGCRRLIDCTPNFLGRDPELLARIADTAGIEIWSNTGLYGAADYKYVPAYARTETAEQLARRWITEAREPWRPRFIKIGVNRAPLGDLDRKLARAAAITSRETGLTIASHTADGEGALEQLEILSAERVRPTQFVWVHAQNERDMRLHRQVAEAGAWVEFDGIAPLTVDWHVECVAAMARRGLLRRVLVSQDAGWYHVGEAGGGKFRDYTGVYRSFLPRLNPSHVPVLMWDNPRAAFGA